MRCRRKSKLIRAAAVAALLAAGLVVCGDRAEGYSWFQFGGLDVIWPQAQSDRWLSPVSFPAGSTPSDHVIAAMGLWTIVPGAQFSYAYGHNPQEFPIDHFDGFNDTIAVPAATLDPGVLGVTTLVNDGADWFDMDIEFADFPAGVGWNFEANPSCEVVSDTVTFGINFLLVATHELGHALGLGHDPIGNEPPGSAWFIATMNPRYPSGGPVGRNAIVELHTDDRNGLRYLYPGSSGARMDLANAGYHAGPTLGKAIPVTVSPSTATAGGVIAAPAVIENFGNVNATDVSYGYYLSTDDVVDTGDLFLGAITLDLFAGDALQFEVEIDVPDLPAGTYYLGSILDDLDGIAEEYEDNNDVVYCNTLQVLQAPPDFPTFSQQVITCDAAYSRPGPELAYPVNMAPVTWSLDNPQPGMSIDPQTGEITWPQPVKSTFPYEIDVRATNAAGTLVRTLSLGVQQPPPAIAPIDDQTFACGTSFVGTTPSLTAPACMGPVLQWFLIEGPPGMTINSGSGVVSWLDPPVTIVPEVVTIRAINAVGHDDMTFMVSNEPSDGDLDGDADVDLADFEILHGCLSGPAGGVGDGCGCADMDFDFDVDLADHALFMQGFSLDVNPLGACCFGGGGCLNLSQGDCGIALGSFQGAGTACGPGVCP